MPTFVAWPISEIITSGPDPFGSEASANEAAVGTARFALDPKAETRFITLEDNDEAEGSTAAEPDYSYLVRLSDSDDAADNLTVHVLDLPMEGRAPVRAIAASERLKPGRSYRVLGIETEGALRPFSSQSICFAAGTLIATRKGPIPVEALRPDDRLQTSDNGYRPVQWLGRWRVNGHGPAAPVRIAPGILNNDRALFVSGQHRVLLRPTAGPLEGEEVLVAAKSLVGLPGVTRAPCERVEWVHVMLDAHEVIFAECARAESMLAGAKTLAVMEPSQARALRRDLAQDPLQSLPARPIVPPAKVARMILSYRGGKGPAAVAGLKLTVGG